QPAVTDAFAGLKLVLVAVPRADEMHVVRERLALVGAVLRDHVDHTVDHDPFAGRAAGMDALVAVSEVGAVLEEYADLGVAGEHDAAVAVLHLGRLGNEAFGHFDRSLDRQPYHGVGQKRRSAGRKATGGPISAPALGRGIEVTRRCGEALLEVGQCVCRWIAMAYTQVGSGSAERRLDSTHRKPVDPTTGWS